MQRMSKNDGLGCRGSLRTGLPSNFVYHFHIVIVSFSWYVPQQQMLTQWLATTRKLTKSRHPSLRVEFACCVSFSTPSGDLGRETVAESPNCHRSRNIEGVLSHMYENLDGAHMWKSIKIKNELEQFKHSCYLQKRTYYPRYYPIKVQHLSWFKVTE